ncbi:transcription regulator [Cryptococcus bacillisporus CA1873]|uniref:Transcription regulator n=1 Tax=Cryptococcus bacillisporus CA1873 TaxID=1296111 RepID=A0ABR5B4N8_CRYGA|nr:transcription regulator [Cryptococcus bacillisporus CA1873]|eukprot:KIR58545.1 transcription regulator [Cryptococcus gattii CA1873]
MAIFNRKKKARLDEEPAPTEKEKVKWSKRPANTAFKQQRLKAWQPILTPKSVLPTLLIIGIIFAPIGALIVWGSGKVTTITLDYTECDADAPTDGSYQAMPSSAYQYDLATSSSESKSSIAAPTWTFSNDSSRAVGETARCEIEFEVPYDLGPGLFLYYKLTNYYQNHRRYSSSFDATQLIGDTRSLSQINGGNCKPITSRDGKPYYPCGLIANSFFNDTFPSVVLLNPTNGAQNQTYNFTESGIAWSGIRKNYASTLTYISPSEVLPPPNWALKYPNGYVDGFPNLREDEHFQVWMRVATLPTFRKLWARNDNEIMAQGRYRVVAYMNYPVKQFDGTKSIVISTVSWIGGKQPFLGWAYIAAAILCVVLAIAGLIRHLIKPRKLGDMSLLSWNQPNPNGL